MGVCACPTLPISSQLCMACGPHAVGCSASAWKTQLISGQARIPASPNTLITLP